MSTNCAEDTELITITGDVRSRGGISSAAANSSSLNKRPNSPHYFSVSIQPTTSPVLNTAPCLCSVFLAPLPTKSVSELVLSANKWQKSSREEKVVSEKDRFLFGKEKESAQFSHSVMSDSLQPHGLQNARPPCQSPTPRVYWSSCPLSWWWHPTISSSVIPFSSCPQSFPASGSFPVSQFFASGGQNIGVSASTSVLPMNIQDWFPSGWTGWISLQSKGLSRVFSNTTVQKHQFFGAQLSL